MARRCKTDTEQGDVFECIESFSTDLDGTPLTLVSGQLVAADHPALALHPRYFRPAASATVATEPHVFRPDPSEQPAPSTPKPRLVRAKRRITVEGIATPGGGYWMEGQTTIEEGQMIPESHPIYLKNRAAFTRVRS